MELFVKLLVAELLLEYSIVERLGCVIPKFLVFIQEDLEVSLYRSSNPNSHTGFGSQLHDYWKSFGGPPVKYF